MEKENIKYPPNNVFEETYGEIVEQKIYETYFEVQNDDIVVDIGSNIGLFPISVEDKFSKCYVIEPEPKNFTSLKENLSNSIDKVIFINEGIANRNSLTIMTDNVGSGMIIGEGLSVEQDLISTIVTRTYKSFTENYKINHIDFLKMDCEGGEYFILTKENKKFLENVSIITGEIHVADEFIVGPDNTQIFKEDVLNMLDVLDDIFDVTYTSIDNVGIPNIKDKLGYYKQFLIHGINKKLKNKVIVEYLDGCAKVTSEKFEIDNPKILSFLNIENNTIEYTSEITNALQWSKTNVKAKEWKVLLGEYSVTVSEHFPRKIIAY